MRFVVLPLLLVAPLSLCAQRIKVEFDTSRDFSTFRTFRLLSGKINSRNPTLNNGLVAQKIDGLIRQYLSARGLTEVPSEPDLNVIYSLGSGRRKEIESYGPGWITIHYTEGTLVLNLRDARRHVLVWRSIAVEDKNDAAKIRASLDAMVRKSFEKYPPKP